MTFEVLIVAGVKIIVFWDVMLYSTVDRLIYTGLHNITLQKTVIGKFLFNYVIWIAQTKHCSWVANAPASYSGGSGFKCWFKDWLSWGVLLFHAVCQCTCLDCTTSYVMPTSSYILPVSVFINHSIICVTNVCATDRIVKVITHK